MTAEPFASDPLPGLRLDGVTISEAIRLQGEARVRYDDDDLRLDVEPALDKPRGWSFPTRTAIITLWIVGLIAALAIASYAQLLRQRNSAAAMDIPPPPPEAAPAAPTTPVPPPEPALSQSAPIAAGAQPPDAAVSPPVTTAGSPEEAAPAFAAKAADSEPAKAKAVEAELAPKAKVEAGTEAKASPADETPAKAKPADDIDHLRRGLNHAYVQAVKAGVPKSVMKQRQVEWAVLYAKAKKKSPEAVAALYRTRTGQLEALARKHHAAAASP
jgi:hypothetical protein